MIKHTDKGTVIFVHPPRCSGTSIEFCLVGSVDDSEKHHTASMIRNQLTKSLWNKWDDAFTFGIVRNPFDRMASVYITHEAPFRHYNLHAGKSMAEFLKRYNIMPWEYGLTCSDYMNEPLDYIIKFENRENGIKEVNLELAKYGLKIDPSQKKRSHPEKKKDFMSYYDQESIEIIKKGFKEDFERWYK